MLERKEHKKMYKSGKNWAVVTLSTAALVFGATTVNASADTNIENNDSSTVQVTTGDNDIAVKSVTLGSGQTTASSAATAKETTSESSNSSVANAQKANSQAADSNNSAPSSSASSSSADNKVANSAQVTDNNGQKAAPTIKDTENNAETPVNTKDSSTTDAEKATPQKENNSKLNKDAENVVKKAGIDPTSLTQDQVKALNKVNFSKNAKTGTQMTYSDLKKIGDALVKQDPRYAIPYFNASQIRNMDAAYTRDAETGEYADLDIWDSWPVQDPVTGYVSNWNGYQLVIAMMGRPHHEDNHIYLLYNKYGDNDFSHWRNAGSIFGYNENSLTQEWSGSAIVNSDNSIQLFYTINDTNNAINHQKLASATMYLTADENGVHIEKVDNNHVVFAGDGYHYQTYDQWKQVNSFDDNYTLRDAHVIQMPNGNRYLVFEGNTGTENYQGENQLYNWSNYGGNDLFNIQSLFHLTNTTNIDYKKAIFANGALGILKLNNDEKNPQVEEVYSPLITSNMVSDELERPNVVKLGDKYYLFSATRLSRGTNIDILNEANKTVGDNVAMIGYVSDSLTGPYRPLNDSGVVLTASVPANWRTATYSYYAVPVKGKANQLLITSYMTNRGEVAGKGMNSTWAPSFIVQVNPDNTTIVLAQATNQGNWVWNDNSENNDMLGTLQTAALPGEMGKPIDWDLIGGYGLKPHDPATPETPTTPETPSTPKTPETPTTPETPSTPQTPETPTTPEVPSTPQTPVTPEDPKQPETKSGRLPQTGNGSNKAVMGLGVATLLGMFGLAGINKRRFN